MSSSDLVPCPQCGTKVVPPLLVAPRTKRPHCGCLIAPASGVPRRMVAVPSPVPLDRPQARPLGDTHAEGLQGRPRGLQGATPSLPPSRSSAPLPAPVEPRAGVPVRKGGQGVRAKPLGRTPQGKRTQSGRGGAPRPGYLDLGPRSRVGYFGPCLRRTLSLRPGTFDDELHLAFVEQLDACVHFLGLRADAEDAEDAEGASHRTRAEALREAAEVLRGLRGT